MRNRRFSLLELLVVIAVIGILVTLLLPSLSNARYKARIAVCASNIKQNNYGVHLYLKQHDNSFPEPYGSSPWGSYVVKQGSNFKNLGILVNENLVPPQVLYCPQQNVNNKLSEPFTGYKATRTIKHNTIYTQEFNISDGEIIIRSGSRARSSYNFLPLQNRSRYKLPQLEVNEILAVDNMISKTRTAHKFGAPGWNVLKLNGSVKFVRSRQIYAEIHDYNDSMNWTLCDKISKILTE